MGDLRSSVDVSSSNTSVHLSPAFSRSQPSTTGTARGSLVKSYWMSENAQGGHTYPAQVPTVEQQIDSKVSCFIFCGTFVETWIVGLKLSPNI